MSKATREWAKRARLKLIEELGGKCVHCGSKRNLEIDHITPKHAWHLYRRYDPSWRMVVYRKEAKQGKLQVLCHACNQKKGPNYPQPRARKVAVR